MQSTVLEDAWIDEVICRPSLSNSVKECDQDPHFPASPLLLSLSNANWLTQRLLSKGVKTQLGTSEWTDYAAVQA